MNKRGGMNEWAEQDRWKDTVEWWMRNKEGKNKQKRKEKKTIKNKRKEKAETEIEERMNER